MGMAQLQELEPCARTPNCETKFIRVPRIAPSEAFCPDCRGMTQKERRNQMRKAARAKAKAQNANAQKGEVTGPHAQAEKMQQAESSATGESVGAAIHGGFPPHPGDPFSSSKEVEKTEDSDDTISLPEEEKCGSLCDNPQNKQRIEHVRDSDKTILDSANERNASTKTSCLGVTFDSQGTYPDVIVPGNRAVPVADFLPTRGNVSRSPMWTNERPQEFQRSAAPSPTLSEQIAAFNAELAANPNSNSLGSLDDYFTEPPAIVLGDPVTPIRSNQTATDFLTPLPAHMAFPQFPVNPSSPEIPIDPMLLQLDAQVYLETHLSNGDPIQNVQDAERFLQEILARDRNNKKKRD